MTQENFKAFTLQQKADILINLVNSCYCSLEIFVENVGSTQQVKQDLQKLNTVGEIKQYINQYI